MKKFLFFVLFYVLLFALPANANVIFPHLMLINLYSIFLFAIPIILIETIYYKKVYNNISVWFWLITTLLVNILSSFTGVFYGAFTSGLLGYSGNIIFLIANFIICCILSWLIEYIAMLTIIKICHKKMNKLFKNVFFANCCSYIIIFILYCILFYIPITHDKFFYGYRGW